LRGAMQIILQDLRYAFRMLARNPSFTVLVILTLALGIGSTTAIFTVVNGVLLRPLPYPEPDRLVYVGMSMGGEQFNPFAYTRDYAFWKDHNRTLSGIAGYESFHANSVANGEAEWIACGLATQSLLPLLNVQPILGRNFLPEEDKPGAPLVAIIEYSFWRRRFNGDPAVVGKAVVLDDKSYSVVGVLPSGFRIPDRYSGQVHYDIWVPFGISDEGKARSILLQVIGRLKPGTTLETARSELDTLMQAQLRKGVKRSVAMLHWHEEVASGAKRSLTLFLGAVAFVLLIVCVNVANLLLSRASARKKELAVRRALGAGRGRIVRQLLTENVTMALLGGAMGFALAYWCEDLLLVLITPMLPALDPIALDYRVLLFNLSLTLVTGIGFGLAPAWQSTKIDLNETLKASGRGATEGGSSRRFRSALVILEVALAMALLSGASLFLKSFLRLRGVDLGFQSDHIMTFDVSLTVSRYPKPVDQARFLEQVLDRLRNLPGVRAVAGGSYLPLTGSTLTFNELAIEGLPVTNSEVSAEIVSADYFLTMGIPVLRGRSFTAADREGAPRVVIVNQSFVRRFLTNQSVLGKRIEDPNLKNAWLTIVGVVGDVRPSPEENAASEIYLSYLQPGQPEITNAGDAFLTVVVRAAGDPMSLVPTVRTQVAQLDRSQPPHGFATLDELRGDWIAPRRVSALLTAVFAALALALACIGIYGVLAYTIAQRTHEIGVRMALGAQKGQILDMVLRKGMGLVAAGIAIGAIVGLALTRFIASELWGVSASDPWTFLSVAAVLAVSGLAACYIPARRATRVDPVVALWQE
jgi:putative ABC transport system permease protein